MIGQLPVRHRFSLHLRARRAALAAGLAGLAAAAVGTGTAVASGHPGRVPSARTTSVLKQDEAFVARRFHHCDYLGSQARCPFSAAVTTTGKGGHLYAVDLQVLTMDDCERGRVFFFNGTHLLSSTTSVRPFSIGGVKAVYAAGTREFAVRYWVSRSRNTTCASNGDAGTDRYVYHWTGSAMAWKSGTPPHLPKVIVGSPADR